MSTLTAGFAQADITPPVGVGMSGYGSRTRPAEGVNDPLIAQALVLTSGEETAAIVCMDNIGLNWDMVCAARQHAERGVGAGDSSGDLVQRAVAPESDDHVDAPAGRVVGEAGGVAAPVGFDHLDVVALGQAAVHDHRVAGGHRRGERVDDEEHTHHESN